MQKLQMNKGWKKRSRQSQHGNWRTSRARRRYILEAQRDKKKVHFASLMDICHLKNAELEQKIQKKKECSKVTLCKTTLENTQFLVNRARPASQMTAAKIMDGVAR